jgi:hypothetical protein
MCKKPIRQGKQSVVSKKKKTIGPTMKTIVE